MTKPTILVVEDDPSVQLVITQTLSADGYAVRATNSLGALHKWIRDGEGDAVVTDVYLGDDCIFDVMPALRLERPDLPFIVMSGQNTILTATSAAEHGAFDYLPKPFNIEALSKLVERALKKKRIGARQIDRETREAERDASLPLIGRSEVMQEVYRVISRVMNMRLPILIEGEAGTGKELAARAIHDLGQYRKTPFLVLNLNELDDAAISEVHEKLEKDQQSTVFIDEVAELSPEAQAVLVRLLRQFESVRCIAATHVDLDHLVAEGIFRRDLFYRLNIVRLKLPPLRERKEDIPELAKAFLVQAREQGLPIKHIDTQALEGFAPYHWPGNVRELQNIIYRLCALNADKIITVKDIEAAMRADVAAPSSKNDSFETEIDNILQLHIMPQLVRADPLVKSEIYQEAYQTIDKSLISMALSASSGNKVRAAALLGLNRNTLRAKMKALNLVDK